MTEELKQALIEHIETDLELWRNVTLKYCHECERDDVLRDIKVNEIALTALTAQPVKVDDSMALAFHKALNDGGVGHEDLEEIKVGLEAALCNIPRSAPAADLAGLVPSEFPAIRLQKAKLWIDRVLMDKPGMKEAQTISAILRNIEEAR
ncbi:hypothetical protein [Pantoea agglomerans]|uniref:hypothetical protein n=1 Tax=Enterobacter agglomerans TaxID=549 RepID=UPI0032079004